MTRRTNRPRLTLKFQRNEKFTLHEVHHLFPCRLCKHARQQIEVGVGIAVERTGLDGRRTVKERIVQPIRAEIPCILAVDVEESVLNARRLIQHMRNGTVLPYRRHIGIERRENVINGIIHGKHSAVTQHTDGGRREILGNRINVVAVVGGIDARRFRHTVTNHRHGIRRYIVFFCSFDKLL